MSPRLRSNGYACRAFIDLNLSGSRRRFREILRRARLANITLVDDDENIVASVSLALESHGHKITAYHEAPPDWRRWRPRRPTW